MESSSAIQTVEDCGAVHSSARAWLITATVASFATLNWADKAIVGVVAQSMKEELGFTSTQIGLAGSAFFLLFSISGALVGFIGDKVRLRWILLILAAVWGLIQFQILVTSTFAVLLATRIVLGAAEGPATALASAAVFQWFPDNRRAFPAALVVAGSSFAKIAAAPLLAFVLVAWGWRACFVATGTASFVWCAVWLAVGKEGPYAKTDKRTESSKISTRIPLKSIFLTKSFIGALLSTFMVYAVVSASITWLPSYFEKGLGFSRLQSGIMFGLPAIGALFTMFGSTIIADRLPHLNSRITRVWPTAVFLLIAGIALASLPLIKAPVTVVCLVVLGYACAVVALPMMNVVVGRIAPPEQLSSTLGLFLAIQNLSGLVAPALVGVLVDRAKNAGVGYSFAYQILGISLIFGAIVVAVLIDPERDEIRDKREVVPRSKFRYRRSTIQKSNV